MKKTTFYTVMLCMMSTYLMGCDTLSALFSTDATYAVNGETSKQNKKDKAKHTKKVLKNWDKQ